MSYDNTTNHMAQSTLRLAVKLSTPPKWFFKFPPSQEPRALPPTPNHMTSTHPFTIPLGLYNKLLDGRVPLTIALIYLTTITYLNSVNTKRNFKPWAISKTRFFKYAVIAHNIFLAVYSAWSFIGMFNALHISTYSFQDTFGVAGTIDSLCKVNGPRGIGSAARYNEQNHAWSIGNKTFQLDSFDPTPELADAGRVWSEGLAFYGWIFYISKFYEVVDTLIIIAKGKKSSILQMYHHAGAMICMWAGIRYMSAPIWMFVLVNSFIHAIMYTFYLSTTLNLKAPLWFKRSLTSLQITQFLVGIVYAFLHLFVKYQSPQAPSASAGFLPAAATELEWVNCLDTSGQAFAVLLNVLYLTPLTVLFMNFFVKSYLQRREKQRESVDKAVSKSLADAGRKASVST